MTDVQILALAVVIVSIINIFVLNRLERVQKALDETKDQMLSLKKRYEKMKCIGIAEKLICESIPSAKLASISTVYDRLPRFTTEEEEESISST